MRTTFSLTTLLGAQRELRERKEAREDHAQDCILWDYEGNNGCLDCAEHDRQVRIARERVRRLKAKEGS